MRDEDRQPDGREAPGDGARASALARAGRRVTRHFDGRDPGDPSGGTDPIELWGRRIGRLLSLAGVVGLTVWLGLQLSWW